MNAHELFGTPQDHAALGAEVDTRPEGMVEDMVTPTILLSLIVCPSLGGLSIALEC